MNHSGRSYVGGTVTHDPGVVGMVDSCAGAPAGSVTCAGALPPDIARGTYAVDPPMGAAVISARDMTLVGYYNV